jgi:FlaA1/EpsC-like NDP-sugar epimerase
LKDLAFLATGRKGSLFQEDLDASRDQIQEQVAGRRLLVIGGAGSIGSSTLRLLADFAPGCLHVVDQSENNLAELVRDLRSRPGGLPVGDLLLLPLDYGSPHMGRFLRSQAPYDFVLNFAALKHVRSEKDVCSSLQMLDTNVLKTARLLRWLAERGGTRGFFSVSTDKAANPVNLMGASKRLMECVMFSGEAAEIPFHVSSARFANVAFSDGSLLNGFLRRMEKGQPLAAPRDTRRFFVSMEEAGQICLLAAFRAPGQHTVIPRLQPDTDLHDLETIARNVIGHFGLAPRTYLDEEAARAGVPGDLAAKAYPLLLTPLDTSGEKAFEEFVGAGESSVELGFSQLAAIPYLPAPAGAVRSFLDRLQGLVDDPDRDLSKADIVAAVREVVPQFDHVETGKSLDNRM